MKIEIDVSGLDAVRNAMQKSVKQASFAASKALNATAFEVNKRIKAEMQSTFKGGATAYAQRAFKVEPAQKTKLQATVMLRTDAPSGGTPYNQALAHLFNGGTRDWKRLESYLRSRKLMPAGLMAVPGRGVALDGRGNIPRRVLNEMLGVLSVGMRNLRVYRRTGKGKTQKAVGYFVVMPGALANRLAPGIYKRVETGNSSTVVPMVLYVRPGTWRKFIDLQVVGKEVVDRTFAANFAREFEAAMRTAR